MGYAPIAPFRRTVNAALIKHQAAARRSTSAAGVDKWEILRTVSEAQDAYGLSHRDVTVLQALISFYPKPILGEDPAAMTIHPSNRAICERLNGMPCSTMRRHLARLVDSGLLLRRDSANGKRYSRRTGGEKHSFGFDLTPLLQRFEEFRDAARAIRHEQQQMKTLRETVKLMRRDLIAYADYGRELAPDLALWDAASDMLSLSARALRRKLTLADLTVLEGDIANLLNNLRARVEALVAPEMSISDNQNEQHNQNSKKDSLESEPEAKLMETPTAERTTADVAQYKETGEVDLSPPDPLQSPTPAAAPLGLVLQTCGEIQTYAADQIRHWPDLMRAAEALRPMMGIDMQTWEDAKRKMGGQGAAITLCAMLERFAEIKNPGGYLRHLSAKAAVGQFSCMPMILALERRAAA